VVARPDVSTTAVSLSWQLLVGSREREGPVPWTPVKESRREWGRVVFELADFVPPSAGSYIILLGVSAQGTGRAGTALVCAFSLLAYRHALIGAGCAALLAGSLLCVGIRLLR
jgi:hypothetical protein